MWTVDIFLKKFTSFGIVRHFANVRYDSLDVWGDLSLMDFEFKVAAVRRGRTLSRNSNDSPVHDYVLYMSKIGHMIADCKGDRVMGLRKQSLRQDST